MAQRSQRSRGVAASCVAMLASALTMATALPAHAAAPARGPSTVVLRESGPRMVVNNGFPATATATRTRPPSGIQHPSTQVSGRVSAGGVKPAAGCGETSCNWAVSGRLTYGGGTSFGNYGVIQGQPRVYLLFVGSAWGTQTFSGNYMAFSNDPSGAAGLLQKEFFGIGRNSERWSNVTTEYCDQVSAGTTSCAGQGLARYIQRPPTIGALQQVNYINDATYNDASPSAMANLVATFAGQNGLTSRAQTVQLILAFAHGRHPDRFPTAGYCAYHTATYAGAYISYTNMPYVTDYPGGGCNDGKTRSITAVASHEYVETLTDPIPDSGWTAPTGTFRYADGTTNPSSDSENGDVCQNHYYANVALSTGTFPLTTSWSNARQACVSS